VYNALWHYFRGKGKVVLCVAPSGIVFSFLAMLMSSLLRGPSYPAGMAMLIN
jgi:hypothetical protein